MILIVGAGAAGLALAYHLKMRRMHFAIVEQAGAGETWAHHYDRLRLNTLKDVSSLPGMPMPEDYPRFPSATQMREYLKRYAEQFHPFLIQGARMIRVEWQTTRWHAETNFGALPEATTLVAATGIWGAPVMPDIAGRDQYRGDILHSSAYRNGKPFAGKRVLVVGAGNSGSEIAVDLSEHDADTSISIRAGVAFVPRPSSLWMAQHGADVLRALPRRIAGALYRSQWHDTRDCGIPWPTGDPLMAYPVVGIDLPNMVRAGRMNVRPGVRAINEASVIFEDGREEAFDAIVFATGYRPALDFIQRDQLVLDERRWPKLDAQWRSVANRHLYCLGYTYPTIEGWLQSIGRFAGEAAHAMAQQAG